MRSGSLVWVPAAVMAVAACGGTGRPSGAVASRAPAPTGSNSVSNAVTNTPDVNTVLATRAVLTADDLPAGWQAALTATPVIPDVLSSAPECAALAAVYRDGLADDAETELRSPDGGTLVIENVAVGFPVSSEQAFDALSADDAGPCLRAVVTGSLERAGHPAPGGSLTSAELTRQPRRGGQDAVGYAFAMAPSGTAPGAGPTIGLRLDVVRMERAIAVLITVNQSGSEPVDPDTVTVAAGQRLGTVPAV